MKTYLSHCLNPTLNKCKHRYIVEDGCGEVVRSRMTLKSVCAYVG